MAFFKWQKGSYQTYPIRKSKFIYIITKYGTTPNFKKLGVTFMNVPKSLNRAIPSQGNVPLRHHLGNEKTTFHVFCHQIR